MLPPINLQVPDGTVAIYITAISLYNDTSTVSVFWRIGTGLYGADFQGPSPSHVLAEKVFQMPIVVVNEIPTQISVSMNFNDTIAHQHSIAGPVATRVGPEGDATQVQISGYAYDDHNHEKPTTVTIVFQGTLHLLAAAVAEPDT